MKMKVKLYCRKIIPLVWGMEKEVFVIFYHYCPYCKSWVESVSYPTCRHFKFPKKQVKQLVEKSKIVYVDTDKVEVGENIEYLNYLSSKDEKEIEKYFRKHKYTGVEIEAEVEKIN